MLHSQKELYQITKTTSLEDFQQQQQLKWVAYLTQRENNDIIMMITFHTTKRLGLERVIS